MAILQELIDDHPTNDISIKLNLIVVHHAANVPTNFAPCRAESAPV
jgi:hypothetical protein